MNEKEKTIIVDVARIFGDNRETIIQKWLSLLLNEKLVRGEEELDYFKKGFEKLVDDFIAYLSAGDFDSYFKSNLELSTMLASYDIEYSKFIKVFHLFEDSYSDLIHKSVDKELIINYMSAIDRLHHETIGIVSETYFEIKDATVFALAKLVEYRDNTTGFHLERTRDYSVILAKELGCRDEFLKHLYKVGPLHDIGKVGIRDRILLKEGPLTEDEYEEMKKHTVIGAQAIDNIIKHRNMRKCYLKMGKEIALHHHEKYDGSGYPYGLAGENIPLSARIFALADAYDAITSKRPYKDAVPHDEAVSRIVCDSGTHFDPVIVKAFLNAAPEFANISSKYNDKAHEQ
ncbi:MAG TPA: HD domain-containing protein [Clostridiaceae bacterium]|nr:HD domain-containing protein [Clostridiaceae bacterium]